MSHDIGKAVRDRLRKRSAVTNLVGECIFADVRDQGKPLPAIVVQVADNNPEHDLSGTNRIFPSTINVIAFAGDRDTANEIAKQIRDDALSADLFGEIEGVKWQEVTLIAGPTETVVEPQDAGDSWIRVTEQQFVIWNAAI
jgi:uncharacterized protein DUF3168